MGDCKYVCCRQVQVYCELNKQQNVYNAQSSGLHSQVVSQIKLPCAGLFPSLLRK